MKYGIVSDLHLEFRDVQVASHYLDEINKSDIDKVILAGDIQQQKSLRDEWLSKIEKPYFFVHGNHDFYKDDMFDDYHEEDEIIGGTMWTNFGEKPDYQFAAQNWISDFRLIKNVSVGLMKDIYYNTIEKIFSSDKEIVVTHFAPSLGSVTDEYKGDILNRYFCNDLNELILNSNKKLWVHGHVHSRHDYMIGNCRVVANPLGYKKENVEPWKMKIVEV